MQGALGDETVTLPNSGDQTPHPDQILMQIKEGSPINLRKISMKTEGQLAKAILKQSKSFNEDCIGIVEVESSPPPRSSPKHYVIDLK